MGVFEKLGLVEKVNTSKDTFEVYGQPTFSGDNFDVNVNTADISENVVEDIYAQNNLSDKSDSIFTVSALIDTLPAEMTTEKKKVTVHNILKVSGKSVEALLLDASNRIEILNAAKDKIISEKSTEVETAKNDIEDLKKAIEAATIVIQKAEKTIENTEDAINSEVKAINALTDFCNGMMEEK